MPEEGEPVGQNSWVVFSSNLCTSIGEIQGVCTKSGSDPAAGVPRVLC